jgi:predicted MFS family arabinose efflux permease
MAAPRERAGSAWAPLRHPTFRTIWAAQFAANVGLWVQSVGAAWLMTSLVQSADLVAMVWSAATLPILFFSMLGGALADAMDRRTVIIMAQAVMMAAALLLALLQEVALITPYLLLALTFLLDSGGAVRQPAYSAAIADLVPREEIPAAVALGSMNFNLARSVGPGIGGLIVAAWGSQAAFLVNAVCVLFAMLSMISWRRVPIERDYNRQNLGRAMIDGVRYSFTDPVIRSVLIRCGAFSTCATAGWALMPLVAKYDLGGDPFTYGLMLGALGLGAVASGGFITPLRHRFGMEPLLAGATIAFTLALLALALIRNEILLLLLLLLAGGAWLAINASFNTIVQMHAPGAIRARALSCYFMAIYGLMSFGAWFWGKLADAIGLHATLLVAAAGLLSTLILSAFAPRERI